MANTQMASITRVWLAFAAIGTALIHFSLASASASLASASATAAVAVGTIAIVLAGLGVCELCWGIAMFVSDRAIAPNAALIVACAPVVAWGLLTLFASFYERATLPALRFVPLAVATVFELLIATVLAMRLRQSRHRGGTERHVVEPGTMRYLGGLLAASIVVAILTTPALAYSGASLPQQDEHSGEAGLVVPSHH